MTFGDRIRYLRFNNKLTQIELAEFLGVSQPTLVRIENRKDGHLPDMELISKLAEKFNVSESYLIGNGKENLDHLPKHLRDFVVNPDNIPYIEDMWIKVEYEKRHM